ncbi:MAG: 16S rRNA processing protein RimM [Ignavibacteria bacterium]|nr:16S rRNA processing protein RimM [Ignavibacteria bacterium]
MDRNNFIAIGKIVKTIGIKGNLKVVYLTDFPERYKTLEKVFLFDEDKNVFLTNGKSVYFYFTEKKISDKYINVKFRDYDSIEKSRELINGFIMIEEKDKVKLNEGIYFYHDLTGCEVYDKGKFIGIVNSVVNYGSGDLFSVKTEIKEILIPFRKEFIEKIDTVNKRIDADLIEGFTD